MANLKKKHHLKINLICLLSCPLLFLFSSSCSTSSSAAREIRKITQGIVFYQFTFPAGLAFFPSVDFQCIYRCYFYDQPRDVLLQSSPTITMMHLNRSSMVTLIVVFVLKRKSLDYMHMWGCGLVVRLLSCHTGARHSILCWRESGDTIYWTNVAPPQWAWHKLHIMSGTAEKWRGGPIATLTHGRAMCRGVGASFSYHAAFVQPAVMGTWWSEKAKL